MLAPGQDAERKKKQKVLGLCLSGENSAEPPERRVGSRRISRFVFPVVFPERFCPAGLWSQSTARSVRAVPCHRDSPAGPNRRHRSVRSSPGEVCLAGRAEHVHGARDICLDAVRISDFSWFWSVLVFNRTSRWFLSSLIRT